jgi:hypothetical protein
LIKYETTGNIDAHKCGYIIPGPVGGGIVPTLSAGPNVYTHHHKEFNCAATFGAIVCSPSSYVVVQDFLQDVTIRFGGDFAVCNETFDEEITGDIGDCDCGVEVVVDQYDTPIEDSQLFSETAAALAAALWIPDSFNTSLTLLGVQTLDPVYGFDPGTYNEGLTVRGIRWKLEHSPTISCYLKVWLVRVIRPQGAPGDGSGDTLDFSIPEYEWIGTGSPLCLPSQDKPPLHVDNRIFSPWTIESNDPTGDPGEAHVRIFKYSFIEGYEPDDPTGLTLSFGGTRPVPDLNPNGFPAVQPAP